MQDVLHRCRPGIARHGVASRTPETNRGRSRLRQIYSNAIVAWKRRPNTPRPRSLALVLRAGSPQRGLEPAPGRGSGAASATGTRPAARHHWTRPAGRDRPDARETQSLAAAAGLPRRKAASRPPIDPNAQLARGVPDLMEIRPAWLSPPRHHVQALVVGLTMVRLVCIDTHSHSILNRALARATSRPRSSGASPNKSPPFPRQSTARTARLFR
jgi:hypothetical protein